MQGYPQPARSSGPSPVLRILGIVALLMVILMGSCVTCMCGGVGVRRSHPARRR